MSEAVPSRALARAIAAHRRGELAAAETFYLDALESEPEQFFAWHGLGVLKAQQGELSASAELLTRAVGLQPGSSDAHSNLGYVLLQQGEPGRAVAELAQAVALDPRNAAAQNNLGLAYGVLGRQSEAEACFRAAVAAAPRYADPHCNLAGLLRSRGAVEAALDHARRAVALRPDFAEAQHALGCALTALGEHEPALAAFQAAARLRPGSAEAAIALGQALARAGHAEEAVRAAVLALGAAPESPELLVHLGDLMMTRGDADTALGCYERAARRRPGFAPAALGEAAVRALRGDLAAGFAGFERRFEAHPDLLFRPPAAPRWQGEDPAGRSVLAFAEQGYGDTIQFARYVPLLAARGARVVVAVQPALRRLFAGLDGAAEVVTRDETAPDCDLQCPIMSLAHGFGTVLETVPAEAPYLTVPAAARAAWEERLSALPRPRIGLAWAGHPGQSHDHLRSLPFAALAPLLALPEAQFVVLQKDRRLGDAAAIAAIPELVDLGASLDDFADTAAVLAGLDLVIAVDSAVAHLGGALGLPVWTLLAHSADWRWLRDRADSPWYPTMRLYRQQRAGDWAGVIELVEAALRGFLAAPAMRKRRAGWLLRHGGKRRREAEAG